MWFLLLLTIVNGIIVAVTVSTDDVDDDYDGILLILVLVQFPTL